MGSGALVNLKKILYNMLYPRPEKVLGLDLGADRVKIVQVNLKNLQNPEVTDYALTDLPAELRGPDTLSDVEGWSTFLSEIINKHGFSATNCVLAIGGRNAFIREIAMPPMSREEMQQAITWDSTQYVPYEADSYYVDFDIFSDLNKDGQQPVILAATPKVVVDSLLSITDKMELNVLRMDVEVLSIYRPMQDLYKDFVLVDMGQQYALMTIFQKGAPVAQRSIPWGAVNFAKIIAEKMNISISSALETMEKEALLTSEAAEEQAVRDALRAEVDAFVKEVRRTSDYYILNKKDTSFTNLVLVGRGSKLAGIAGYMDDLLDVKVAIFNILDKVKFDSRFEKKKVAENAPSLVAAIGAALAGGESND